MILSESMSDKDSQIHFTLIIHSYRNGPKLATMQRSIADISSFFGRFQMPYELIWLNPSDNLSENTIPHSDANLNLVVRKDGGNKVAALHRAILCARGEVVIVADENLATPLGDLFRILQTAIGERKWVWGERNFAKLRSEKSKRLQHDEIFTKILLDKNSKAHNDIFCETWGFAKGIWLQRFQDAPNKPLLSLALSTSLPPSEIVRVKISDSGLSPRHYPQLRLWLSRFFFSIK